MFAFARQVLLLFERQKLIHLYTTTFFAYCLHMRGSGFLCLTFCYFPAGSHPVSDTTTPTQQPVRNNPLTFHANWGSGLFWHAAPI
jgi:hypothetical protein